MSAEQHMVLAEHYLSSAKKAFSDGDYRATSVLSTMAAEMAGRALLISRGLTKPRSHGALPALIGKEFVAKGELSSEVGRKLHILMERRGKIFYEPTYEISREEAEEAMSLSEHFIAQAKSFIEAKLG